MREQWCYIAIAYMFGIALVTLQVSIVSTCMAGGYAVYCILRLRPRTAAAAGLAFLISFLYVSYTDAHNQSTNRPGPASLHAVLTDAPQMDGDRMSAWIQAPKGEKLRLVYTISSPAEQKQLSKLKAGMTCLFHGEREVPDGPRNFHAFDYADYLRKQQVHHLFRASSFSSCAFQNPSFVQWLFSVRQAAVAYVHQTFPGETAGFINSLLYGDRQDISRETEDSYQELGLIHLLAISGSHISLLTAVVYYVLLRVGLTRETTTVLLFVIVPLYMFLAGASPSVVRASVAAVIMLACTMLPVRISGMDAVSLTALLMLLWDPYLLYDIGFQFSFLSAASLLLSARVVLAEGNGAFRNLLHVAIVAQLVALPVTLHHFGQFSPYSILLNLIYVPFLSLVIMPLCFFALLVSVFIPIAGQGVAYVLTYLLEVSNAFLHVCEKLPFGNLTFGHSPWWLTAAYCGALLWLLVEWERGGRLMLAWGVFALLLSGHYVAVYMNPNGNVTFLDVGQGDCILIQLPYGKGTYVIDTGGTISFPKEEWQRRKRVYEVGKDTVLPYLRSLGIKKIDKLILTHGDYDHIGAVSGILEEMPVQEVLIGGKRTYSPLETTVQKEAQRLGSRIITARDGMSWQAGEAIFTVVAPEGTEQEGNDASIVLKASIGGLKWLFTGDIEQEGEERLLTRAVELRTDVLKISHHGSGTSTSAEWLNVSRPDIAIISVGGKNRYGHPHQEVVQRLRERGIQVLRTDQSGAIAYIFRGNHGTFRTALTYDDSTEGK